MKKGKGSEMKGIAWGKAVAGTCVGTIAMLVLMILSAWGISSGLIGQEWIEELSALALLIGSFVTGMLAAAEGKRWVEPGLSVALFWIELLIINLLLYGGDMKGLLAVGLILMGGSGASLLLGTGKTGRKRRRKRGYR